jgi:hypothetical protein
MHVQHIVDGFVCIIPPGAPVVARDSNGVATAVHLFLGKREVSDLSSAEKSDEVVEFNWPDATVAQGAVFNVSKVPRVRNGYVQPRGGFMLTYHTTLPNSAVQAAEFNRAAVMDKLKTWITTGSPIDDEVQDHHALVTLAGMRINPEMSTDDETVFVMHVAHASQVEDFAGPCPFVARCTDPRMSIGVVDEDVVGYLAEELGRDLEGDFAVRVHEAFLEFGPRVEDD